MIEEQNNNSVQDQYGNSSKPLLPVVFWAHFRSKNNESDRLQRWKDGREPVTIIEWISEKRKELESEFGESYCMTNCGVIR